MFNKGDKPVDFLESNQYFIKGKVLYEYPRVIIETTGKDFEYYFKSDDAAISKYNIIQDAVRCGLALSSDDIEEKSELKSSG